MAAAPGLDVNAGDVVVIAGTTKGVFLFRSDASREKWELGGPYLQGQSVYAAGYDGRADRHRVWVSSSTMHWGTVLRSSDDFGSTWSEPEAYPIKFPADSTDTLSQIWQIVPGGPSEPDTLYCGVTPAALFVSRDAGESWSLVRGLYDHPHRATWMPGNGGLCLHTILPAASNTERMFVAISTGGVYRTDDGGKTWGPRNQGVRAEFMPDKYPEYGQCVHKIARHPAHPDRLYLQNHWGLYRTEDGGDSWKDIAGNVPSDFGFAMAADSNSPDTVYIVPLQSDEFRCTPDGRLRVYRTRDGGGAWEPLTKGLPQEHAFETVLRDGLTTDSLSPTGVYFGTRSGKLFGSREAGDSWQTIVDGLPPVLTVKTTVVS